MSELDFRSLGERMIQAGVAPRHVRRMLAELSEHGAQLELDARQRGLDPVAARAAAREVLGSDEEILTRALATPSLRSWGTRWPVVTMLLAPVVGCCLSGALSLALAVLFYQVGTSAHLAAPDQTSPGPFWYALTTGLTHLAVYILPLLWALLVMRYAVSRRLTATGILLLSIRSHTDNGLFGARGTRCERSRRLEERAARWIVLQKKCSSSLAPSWRLALRVQAPRL